MLYMKIRFKLVILVLACSILLSSSMTAFGFTWENIRLSYNPNFSVNPDIVASGSNIYVVWSDDNNTPGNSDIFLNMSRDCGRSWSFKRLSTYDWSILPSIAATGNNTYVAWSDGSIPHNGYAEIFFKSSNNIGRTWSSNKRLSYDYNNSMYSSVAVSGKNIYVVWFDEAHGTEPKNNEIYINMSNDGGKTWKFKRLTYSSGNSKMPSVTAYGNKTYVVWQDDTHRGFPNIYIKISNNSGKTWTTKRLTNSSSYGTGFPDIAVYRDNIYVVWSDNSIYMISSNNSGKSWSSIKKLIIGGLRPSVAVNGNNIYVVWEYDGRIYMKYSDDDGNTWTFKERVSMNNDWSQYPSVAYGCNKIYVSWEEDIQYPFNPEICLGIGS